MASTIDYKIFLSRPRCIFMPIKGIDARNAKWVSKSLSFLQDDEDNSIVTQSLQISIELYNSGQIVFTQI